MNFDQFIALGEHIRSGLFEANRDYGRLPEIAATALREADLDETVDLRALAQFFAVTNIKQQPGSGFSNLPPVVYRCDDFQIELLFWANATTQIHQHAFSGAFRVLAGSSFHSRWRFDERERISQSFLIGECSFQSAEILTKGDVCAIHSGREGLLHALFHLDQPSVTLVVRTYSEPWAKPQYTIYPPNIALDKDVLLSDDRVRLLVRVINTSRVLGHDPMPVILDSVDSLDLPRVFGLTIHLLDTVLGHDDAAWDTYIGAVRGRFGAYADLFLAERDAFKRERSLIATRNSVTDPDLRFFLALLLNAPTRDWIYKLCAERYPETDPETFCIDALDRLRGREKLANAFADLVQKAKLGQHRFAARLGQALPFEEGDARAVETLRAGLNGETAADETAAMVVNLRGLPELSPLFR